MRSNYLSPRLLVYLLALLAVLGAWVYWQYKPTEASHEAASYRRDWREISADAPMVIATGYTDITNPEDVRDLESVYTLARLITQRTGVEVRVRLEPLLGNMLDALERGEIDLLAGELIRTSEVDSQHFAWIRPRLLPPLYLAQRRDSATYITEQLGLVGKTIALPQGSPYKFFAQHLSEELGGPIHIVEYPHLSSDSIIELVRSGKLKYTLVSARTARQHAQQKDSLDMALPITFNLRGGWLLRRNAPDLKDSLNIWLGNLR